MAADTNHELSVNPMTTPIPSFRRRLLSLSFALSLATGGMARAADDVAPPRQAPAAAASFAEDHSYVRAGELMVRLPDGWKLTDQGGTFVMTPPQVPALETVKIVMSPVSPLKPSLRDQMQSEIDAGQKIPAFTQESPMTPIRHPAGYEVLGMLVSFNDKSPLLIHPPKTYAMLVHLDLGPDLGSAPLMLYASTRELAGEHMKTFDTFVSELRVPARTVLADAAGHPPLTLRTVNQVNDFLEWLLDVPFTQSQRGHVTEYLVDAWRRRDAEGIEAIQSIQDIRRKLDELTPEQKAFAREAARVEALKVWRADAVGGDTMARLMVEIHDTAHAPLATGGPAEAPLTRQNADASLEILYFMASKAADPSPRGYQHYPTAEEKNQWARELTAKYASLPAENKQELAEMASKWAALRLLWPELSGEDRAKLAEGWASNPPVQALLQQVKSGQKAAEARELGNIMRQMDAHRQLVNMGAYRLNYRYVYR